jgi:phage terminase small subunit
MTARFEPPAVSFQTACAAALIALALRLGASPAARKDNLATLYENGAITAQDLAWALKTYDLEGA